MNGKSVRDIMWVIILTLTCTGCASCQNEIKMSGGLVGTYPGDYIVLNQSGGDTLDVWKLRNVYVEEHGPGWRFPDNNGNMVFIGGDVKVTRIINSTDWERYHEYHSELESQTYRQKYNSSK